MRSFAATFGQFLLNIDFTVTSRVWSNPVMGACSTFRRGSFLAPWSPTLLSLVFPLCGLSCCPSASLPLLPLPSLLFARLASVAPVLFVPFSLPVPSMGASAAVIGERTFRRTLLTFYWQETSMRDVARCLLANGTSPGSANRKYGLIWIRYDTIRYDTIRYVCVGVKQ